MVQVTGTVHRITYQNNDNGYSVVKILPSIDSGKRLFDVKSDHDQTITVTGSIGILKKGDQTDLWGEWKSHSKYGTYLEVERFHIHSPTTVVGLTAFLSTDHFKGVGPVTAELLVAEFGEDLPKIIEETPSKLTKVKGINAEKAREIHEAWIRAKSVREEMIALQGIGLTPNTAQKVIGRYPGNALKVIRENPYQLAQDIWGVGFTKADTIAKQIGFAHTHPFRIQSGINYALLEALDDGHMYLPKDELLEKSEKLLTVDQKLIVPELSELIENKLLVQTEVDTDAGTDLAIYLTDQFEQEQELAHRLTRLNQAEKKTDKLKKIKIKAVSDDLIKVAKVRGITLAKEQELAIIEAVRSQISVLTGGPGTGKSTTIDSLLRLIKLHSVRVALTAPTGRAAKRMEEITGLTAYTLHRLLQLKPGEMPKYNQDNPLPYDLVVVDEVSMLDTTLALALVRALEPGTHLLLVGDVDQLPSVQAGNVLSDIVKSNKFAVTKLNTIFRQSEASAIIRNAHRIREGLFPELPPHPSDFYFFAAESLEEVTSTVVDLVTKRIPSEFKFDIKRDIQVMSPLYKTLAGVTNLNAQIQAVVNPKSHTKNEVKYGFQVLREADRVMQLKNDYEKEVFNGDVGTVVGVVNGADIELAVQFPDKPNPLIYKNEQIKELTLAYAVSVHKSQGSEYPVVVMPITTSHYIMLQRNLLYTAVTRAKKLVVLVGSKKAIFIALNNDKPQKRYSGLMNKIRSINIV